MSRLKLFLPAVIAMGAFLVCTTATFGKAEYTKKEKKACVYCHTKANTKDLNEVGKCYDKDKSLANCKAPAEKK
jgi:cytochrome c553